MKLQEMKNQKAIPNSLKFYESMKFPIIISQCFGFFPISGITNTNCQNTKFKWRTWRMLYAFIIFLGMLVSVVTQFLNCIYYSLNIYETTSLVFSVLSIVDTLLFFKVALEWQQICKEWHNVEKIMKNYDSNSLNLKRHIQVLSIIFLCFGAIEHFLVLAYKLKDSFNLYSNAYDALRHYFRITSESHIFKFLPYNMWISIFFQVTDIYI
ncbi:unnamed protein product [Brassicogethes aeneus]|uniref:Uncharacterized protein n=1 Tax=Brassicogethes aeneus TaxID=1431903 RepID=A0A9P0B8K5_BRAAE|nr:unnamed protein product [Brassicogethes aeneus]